MNNDLISREALKKALSFIYDCEYIDSKSKEGIASDIIAEIDNAPAVEQNWRFYYDHGYAQAKRDFERPQGEWTNKHFEHADCSLCGRTNDYHGDFCKYCGSDNRGTKE